MNNEIGVKKLVEMKIETIYEKEFIIKELQESLPLKITKDFDIYLEDKQINIIYNGIDYFIDDGDRVIYSVVKNSNLIERCKEGMVIITKYLNQYIKNDIIKLNNERSIKLNIILPVDEKEIININYFNLSKDKLKDIIIGEIILAGDDCKINVEKITYGQVSGWSDLISHRGVPYRSAIEKRSYSFIRRELSKLTQKFNNEIYDILKTRLYSIEVEGNNIDEVNSYSELLISKIEEKKLLNIINIMKQMSEEYKDKIKINVYPYLSELRPSVRNRFLTRIDDGNMDEG